MKGCKTSLRVIRVYADGYLEPWNPSDYDYGPQEGEYWREALLESDPIGWAYPYSVYANGTTAPDRECSYGELQYIDEHHEWRDAWCGDVESAGTGDGYGVSINLLGSEYEEQIRAMREALDVERPPLRSAP